MIATPPVAEDAGRRNLLLLVQLRWLAVAGQMATILAVQFGMGVALPILPMFATLGLLIGLNLVQLLAERRRPVTNGQLLAALLIDVAALSVQLYLSGGATNPFAGLFLLQVVLGAVLLRPRSGWLLVAVTSAAFAALTVEYRPLDLSPRFASALSAPYLIGNWFNFTLAAVLIVLFVTRITRNLSERDARLAAMRQHAAEAEHIVRMGLLASGAAHELGTPLASVAVALGDWAREPAIRSDPALAAEVEDMRAEVARCKDILSGILLASGEVTGQAPERTTLRRFLTDIIARWDSAHPGLVSVDDALGPDLGIVADRALAQALSNVLDNAAEAGARQIELEARRTRDTLILSVRDDGRGVPAAILAHLGKPYQSSKNRRGAGLGLFLTSNVLRVLGGTLAVSNRDGGGAEVVLRLPLAALSLEEAT
ncbi:ATP-binding protein [Sphingomonas sp.]|uniref:ATP-binding protein n=1 Tax=Sphingomonas sp. TaxID=28214 RepID=UPI002B73089D|nr:ATP-binding protein [Sphingomonas sp.]HTG38144.1 ATP-binding protein [Sphingomonas sp.]